jgi:two-component system, NtrC family, sensor kinase
MRRLILIFFIIQVIIYKGIGQEEVVILTSDLFQSHQRLFLAPLDGWIYHPGHDQIWANPDLDVSTWQAFNPTQLNTELEDASGRIEGWFRIKIKLDESMKDIPLFLSRNLWAATDIYLDGKLIHAFGNTGNPYQAFNPNSEIPGPHRFGSWKGICSCCPFCGLRDLFYPT